MVLNNTSVFTELNKPAVERKKATTIPTIKMVVKRSTALVESHTKAARIKQKIKDPEVRPISTALSAEPKAWLSKFCVIPPPEVM